MISYLRIERFKCFEDQVITFRNLTLLTGNNGTGKSTVLQALLLLRQAFTSGRLKENEIPLNGDLIKIGTAKDALFRGSQEDSIAFTMCLSDKKNKDLIFRWEFDYLQSSPDDHFMRGRSEIVNMPLVNPFAGRFFYLTAERLGPRLSYPMAESPRDKMGVGIKGEHTAHCLEEFGSEPIQIPELAKESVDGGLNLSLSNQAQLWMRSIVPGLAFNTETINKSDSVRLELRVYSEGTDYLRPTNMGFGICFTLPIVIAGLMATPGAILIIENPEAHLHPAGQSSIGEFLAKLAAHGVQVFIETHSDHVLNGIRKSVKQGIVSHEDVDIHYFSRGVGLGSNSVTQPRLYRDGGIDKWPEGFFDQMEKDLGELF